MRGLGSTVHIPFHTLNHLQLTGSRKDRAPDKVELIQYECFKVGPLNHSDILENVYANT